MIKPDWMLAERVRDVPQVDEALRNFVGDHSGDNATGIVVAVLEAYYKMNTGPTAIWRVAEFWSSANPKNKVRMLAEGHAEIAEWEKRGDFIRWLSEPTEFDL